jgi:cytochrome P450
LVSAALLCFANFSLFITALGLRNPTDVIGELTFSKRFGFIDEGTDKGTFVHIDGALQSAAWIGQVPWLYWVHDWLSPWIGNHLKITNRHGLLREISAREVSQRNSVPSSHPDMLDKFMDVHRNHPGQFDNAAVMSMAASNIFAGSDTTAISIGAILYYLCKYPQHKEKLMEEIFAEADAGRIGRTNVPYKVARDMPYLQACIQEGLRCHPAVGMSLPRVVPPGGLAVNGVHIPGGVS